MSKLLNFKYTLAGLVIGAIAGYLYWQFIGCMTGSCAITSNPVNSTLYGAFLGGMVITTFKKDKENHSKENLKKPFNNF